MNSNTTIALALVCAALAAGFFFIRGKQSAQSEEVFNLPTSPTQLTTHDLLDEEARLADPVRIEIKREGKDTLIFEKDKTATVGPAVWNMTAPVKMKVRAHEAQAFGTNIDNLTYEISYRSGETDAVSESDAGLAPPAGTITVEDTAGKTVTVEVGKQISKTQRYVRLADDDRICVGNIDLFKSLKSNIVDYRDPALWNFSPTNVTKIEVTDRSAKGEPVNYVFVKDGDKWIITAPVSAPATEKVNQMVAAISRLRATKWEADAKNSLAAYGLATAAITIKVTVEKKVPVEQEDDSDSETGDDDKDKPTEMKTQTQTYILHVSNRSPIGEDTKTYMRVGDETMVATLMKTTADKLKPVMAEWRDMRLTAANIDIASRIAINIDGESAAFTKGDKGWSFESDGGNVEPSQLTKLLAAIKSLNAVVFVETSGDDLANFGLEPPRATIAVTLPSLETPLRLTIGNYTDPKTKRLVYVQKNSEPSIAKVRTKDLDAILSKPLLYRDRKILSLDASAVTAIQITQNETVGESNLATTFERIGDKWQMTDPVSAEANTAKLNELATAFTHFKANAVVADGGEASAFGLHAPKLSFIISSKKNDSDETKTKTVTFVATQHDGKHYLKRDDRSAIYELSPAEYNRLSAEFRSTKLCSANEDDVTAFTITQDIDENGFTLSNGKWTYQTEPDLPLNQQKIKTLLKQILDFRANRFVQHTTANLPKYGLDAPARKFTLALTDGSTWTLDVSSKTGTISGGKALFATTPNQPGVFLIAESALTPLKINLDDLESR